MTDYISKPVNRQALLDTVSRLLNSEKCADSSKRMSAPAPDRDQGLRPDELDALLAQIDIAAA